jgi:hypothetical protein
MKKPYLLPQLTEYGSVEDLTRQGGAPGMADTIFNNSPNPVQGGDGNLIAPGSSGPGFGTTGDALVIPR